MADVIQYFTQLPDTNGYTTIVRRVTLTGLGLGTFNYGTVPDGTQMVAVFATDIAGAGAPIIPGRTEPRLNGTLIGYGRSDVAAPALMYDWAPYTFTCGQQGILTVDFDGTAAWAGLAIDLFLYVYIPQIPCP